MHKVHRCLALLLLTPFFVGGAFVPQSMLQNSSFPLCSLLEDTPHPTCNTLTYGPNMLFPMKKAQMEERQFVLQT